MSEKLMLGTNHIMHLLTFAAIILVLKIYYFSKSGKVDLSGFANKLLILGSLQSALNISVPAI